MLNASSYRFLLCIAPARAPVLFLTVAHFAVARAGDVWRAIFVCRIWWAVAVTATLPTCSAVPVAWLAAIVLPWYSCCR
jgi:hypothetical protein